MIKVKINTLSIRTKLWILISILVMGSVVGVTIVSSRITTRFIADEAQRDLARNTRMFAERLNLIRNETAVFSKMTISNKDIQDFSRDAGPWTFSDDQEIKRYLVDFVKPRTFIEAVNLYYKGSGSYYSSQTSLETSSYFDSHTAELCGELSPALREIWGLPFLSADSQNFLLPYYRKIYYGKSGRELGLMEALVPVEMFTSSIDNSIISENGSLYIINREGDVIVHNDPLMMLERIGEKKLDFIRENLNRTALFEGSLLCHSRTDPDTGWIIINEVPRRDLLGHAADMRLNFLIIALSALCCSILLAFRLSGSITRPIIDMERSIGATDSLGGRKYVPVSGSDEIGKLAEQYNRMIDRIAQAAETERQRELQIKQYELALLQSQINPHFLNNILENVSGLIELDRREDSLSLIRDTADFYRSILSTDNLIIPLEQELRIASLYMKIQNVRCRNRIRPVIDIPDELKEKPIVKLTLQPLVENAIRHGMDLEGSPLDIRIDCLRQREELVIRIQDSGIGMGAGLLEDVLRKERRSEDGRPSHIGVYATDQRLKLHFGPAYGLSYRSSPGEGTTVEIHLPGEIETHEIRQ